MQSILIVNCDEIFLAELATLLKNAHYQVIATTNSLEALGLFKKYTPYAVIIDIYMEQKDGFEITKEIRAICQDTFILVISARNDCLNIITYLGADLALSSSVNPALIINAVAVAEKKQALFTKGFLLSDDYPDRKIALKVA